MANSGFKARNKIIADMVNVHKEADGSLEEQASSSLQV
jgi:hypothetical protein